MANKFTQSILERQYKEAQEKKRTKKATPAKIDEVPENKTATPVIIEAVTHSAPEELVEQPVKQGIARTVEAVKAERLTSTENPLVEPIPTTAIELNLDAYIIKGNNRIARNKTFYLDQNVIEGIKSAAKRQKVTDSKLVNDILKKVLAL